MKKTSITGRDDWIIARALYVASKALQRSRLPAYSDAADMRILLAVRYPSMLYHFELQDLLGLALERGYEPDGPVSRVDVERFLAANPTPDNVVAFGPRADDGEVA